MGLDGPGKHIEYIKVNHQGLFRHQANYYTFVVFDQGFFATDTFEFSATGRGQHGIEHHHDRLHHRRVRNHSDMYRTRVFYIRPFGGDSSA